MCLKLFIMLFISLCGIEAKSDVETDIENYEAHLNKLRGMLLAERSSSELVAASLGLAQQSEKVIDAYAKFHPVCSEYFEVLISHGFKIRTMSPQAIKFNYIEENALPPAQPHCRDPKALYIEALSVASMLKQEKKEYKKMLRELEKASKHLVSLKDVLL